MSPTAPPFRLFAVLVTILRDIYLSALGVHLYYPQGQRQMRAFCRLGKVLLLPFDLTQALQICACCLQTHKSCVSAWSSTLHERLSYWRRNTAPFVDVRARGCVLNASWQTERGIPERDIANHRARRAGSKAKKPAIIFAGKDSHTRMNSYGCNGRGGTLIGQDPGSIEGEMSNVTNAESSSQAKDKSAKIMLGSAFSMERLPAGKRASAEAASAAAEAVAATNVGAFVRDCREGRLHV